MSRLSQQYNRREILRLSAAGLAALNTTGCSPARRSGPGIRSVIVLGIDAMDPTLLKKYMAEGRMPNARKLIEQGSLALMGTSNPPQSPTAWSNFSSGTNPGGHGIYDFIARDPKTLTPYFSGTRLDNPTRTVSIGGYQIPLSAGKVTNLRGGPTFWNNLEEQGVDCTLLRIPINFPPVASKAKTLSGMGTPDIHGSYGTFTFYTDKPAETNRNVHGGHIERVEIHEHQVSTRVLGPENSMAEGHPRVDVPLEVFIDPANPAVRILVQGYDFILKEGEWSDWLTLDFPLLRPLASVTGICRLFLKKVRDDFGLYMTPVNIDPANPSLPISTPGNYASELAAELGKFYTQGFPEDTHALSAGVFDDNDYRHQALQTLEAELKIFEHEFSRFQQGFFFFYFSTIDLNSHMFWRTVDPRHPLYTPELARKQGDFLPSLYEKMDAVIGTAMKRVDERTLLIAMSDHGFLSFRRQFNLNSWLLENGFATLTADAPRGGGFFTGVDWKNTRAYGLGINSLYLNLQGREPDGRVAPQDKAALLTELATRLKAVRDPQNGAAVICNVYQAAEIYSGPYVDAAPDLLIGYNVNYRASWDTILGGFPEGLVLDNTNPWSGDHCMDSTLLPGVFLSNRAIRVQQPGLEDMAPSILEAFGVPVPKEMTGRNVFHT